MAICWAGEDVEAQRLEVQPPVAVVARLEPEVAVAAGQEPEDVVLSVLLDLYAHDLFALHATPLADCVCANASLAHLEPEAVGGFRRHEDSRPVPDDRAAPNHGPGRRRQQDLPAEKSRRSFLGAAGDNQLLRRDVAPGHLDGGGQRGQAHRAQVDEGGAGAARPAGHGRERQRLRVPNPSRCSRFSFTMPCLTSG